MKRKTRKPRKSSLRTRIDNYLLRLTPKEIKEATKAFPEFRARVEEIQAEIRAERKERGNKAWVEPARKDIVRGRKAKRGRK